MMGEEPDLDAIAKLAQKCFASNPVIVLGSGASMSHELPGMSDLQAALSATVHPSGPGESDAWNKVEAALQAGDHLENALTGSTLPASLVAKIIHATWQCVNQRDKAVYLKTLSGTETFAVGQLLQTLSRSSNLTIDLVTTNYDRIVEYACDTAGILYSTGFLPGYVQSREGTDRITLYRGHKQARTVRIWKVHGSLDWFERLDGTTVSAPQFEPPLADLTPLIVTPGVSKFQRTHDEPFRSVIQGADRALEHAEGVICFGFGFRDTHIEPKLVARCRQTNVPVTVLARTLTEEAKAF